MARTTTLLLCLIMTPVFFLTGAAQAEDPPGALCVTAYDDTNRSATREATEKTLVDINVSLLNPSKVIVANHVLTDESPYCFSGLPPAAYYIQISSPQYESLEDTPVALEVMAGVQLTREFPAVLKSTLLTTTESILYLPATVPVRLAISTLGAVLALGLFAGVGFVLFGLFFHRRGGIVEDVVSAPYEESAEGYDDLPVLTRVQRAELHPPVEDENPDSFGSQYDIPK